MKMKILMVSLMLVGFVIRFSEGIGIVIADPSDQIFASHVHKRCRTTLPCSDWSQQHGHSCLFADGPLLQKWVRKCESRCENQVFCLERGQNPNTMQDECTPWKENPGHTCLNEKSGELEQQWIRQCLHGDREFLFCQDEAPHENFF